MRKTFKLCGSVLLGLLVAGSPVLAQQIVVNNKALDALSAKKISLTFNPNKQYSSYQVGDYTVYSPVVNSSLRAGEATVTVNLKSVNASGYTCTAMAIYNENDLYAAEKIEKNNGTVVAPKGTYDMHAYYSKGSQVFVVFKEHVTIDKDTTIEFDPASATKPYIVRSYDETGVEMTLDRKRGNDVITPGNTEFLSSSTCFIVDGTRNALMMFGGDYRSADIEEDFNISPVSERFTLADTRSMTHNGKEYLLGYISDFKSKEIKNDPKLIKPFTQKFNLSRHGQYSEFKNDHFAGFDFTLSYNNVMHVNTRYYIPRKVISDGVVSCMADLSNHGDNKFMPLLALRITDTNVKVQGEEYPTYFFVAGPQYTFINGKFTARNHGLLNRFDRDNTGRNVIVGPGVDAYNFTLDEQGDFVYGNCCPIASVVTYDNGTQPYPAYVGRYGEELGSDIQFVEGTKEQAGRRTIITLSNTNNMVDGNYTKNVLIHDVDLNNTNDNVAPTLQMLQLRNKQGKITHVFPNSEDGVINFSCADFREHPVDEMYYYYACEKVSSVKLFIAPTKTENKWIEIATEEVPDNYYFPAYGNFYTAKLGKLAEGWYDLKFELTDKAGNKQTQIVQPTLFIGTNPTEALRPMAKVNLTYAVNGNVLYISNDACQSLTLFNMAGEVQTTALGNSIDIAKLPKGVYVLVATINGMVYRTKVVL